MASYLRLILILTAVVISALAGIANDQPQAKNNERYSWPPGDSTLSSTEVEDLHESAERGDLKAQVKLGRYYFSSNGIESFQWFKKATEKAGENPFDTAEAQIGLGWCYKEGKGVEKNEAEGDEWLRKGTELENKTRDAAELGNAKAQVQLAYHYLLRDNGIEAFKWFKKAAENRDSEPLSVIFKWFKKEEENTDSDPLSVAQAQYWLGMSFLGGTLVEKNEAEAEKWFKKSYELSYNTYRKRAEQGDAEAANALGDLLLLQTSFLIPKKIIPEDEAKAEAVKWFKKSAELGFAEAQNTLGWIYNNGEGAPQDESEAFKWFRKAAEQGHAKSQSTLAHWYAIGKVVPEDDAEAVKWYRKAAEQGLATAQNILGDFYLSGIGVKKDEAEAVKWYRMGADQGDEGSQTDLGRCYAQGIGVPKNNAEALKWFYKVAKRNRISAFQFGRDYYNGWNDVEKDLTEAVKFFQISAERGHDGAPFYDDAQFQLGVCYENGEGVPKDDAEAVKWFRKAAEQGDASAQSSLGICYFKGRGVEKDEVEAVKWFRKAAEKEMKHAQLALGYCYQDGKGVKRDLKQAVAWYEKAMKGGSEEAVAQLALLLSNPRKDDDKFKPDYKRAALLLEQLADKTESHYCKLGYIYGKIKNLDKMIQAYEKAVNLGSATAMSNMAACYRKGDGVVKNYAESLAYEYLAQANGQPNKEAISFLENYLAPASIQAAQKKAQLLHAQIKENKNKPKSDTVSKAPKGDTPSRPSGSGSGVIISKAGIVATAFHVVEGATIIKIKTSDATYKGEVLASDKSNDIAILQIEGGDPSFSAVPIASSGAVKLGQSVFTLGFPNIEVQGFNLKMTKGDISSTSGIQDDPRLFQISVPVQSGNSGGPLFDENGNVVGIVVAKLNAAFMAKHTGDLPQNVNYAVKSAYLKPLVEEFSEQLPNSNRSTEEEKTEDLVSKVKDACVMILVE
jgi:TPR repeat protein